MFVGEVVILVVVAFVVVVVVFVVGRGVSVTVFGKVCNTCRMNTECKFNFFWCSCTNSCITSCSTSSGASINKIRSTECLIIVILVDIFIVFVVVRVVVGGIKKEIG